MERFEGKLRLLPCPIKSFVLNTFIFYLIQFFKSIWAINEQIRPIRKNLFSFTVVDLRTINKIWRLLHQRVHQRLSLFYRCKLTAIHANAFENTQKTSKMVRNFISISSSYRREKEMALKLMSLWSTSDLLAVNFSNLIVF